jgi:hypothetical protein
MKKQKISEFSFKYKTFILLKIAKLSFKNGAFFFEGTKNNRVFIQVQSLSFQEMAKTFVKVRSFCFSKKEQKKTLAFVSQKWLRSFRCEASAPRPPPELGLQIPTFYYCPSMHHNSTS